MRTLTLVTAATLVTGIRSESRQPPRDSTNARPARATRALVCPPRGIGIPTAQVINLADLARIRTGAETGMSSPSASPLSSPLSGGPPTSVSVAGERVLLFDLNRPLASGPAPGSEACASPPIVRDTSRALLDSMLRTLRTVPKPRKP